MYTCGTYMRMWELQPKKWCYGLIAFDKRVTFGFDAHIHCLVHVPMLLYLHVGSRITITQVHTQTMQQTQEQGSGRAH